MRTPEFLNKFSWSSFPCLLIILVFCVTRFHSLEEFPIYFFCDEAFVGVASHKLFANYFFSDDGTFLPLFWEKARGRWVPQISIYLSMLPSFIWPRSIVALRALTGILSLTGILIMQWGVRKAYAPSSIRTGQDSQESLLSLGGDFSERANESGLIKAESADIVNLRRTRVELLSWLPLGLATITPVLLLHNRLAFETSNVISGLFASFGFYIAYRTNSFNYLTGFILSALFTFYSHLSGSIIITAIVLVLLITDYSYHSLVLRMHGRFYSGNLIFALIGLIPLFAFLYLHPSAPALQLSILGSDLTKDVSLSQLILNGSFRYFKAFDPAYWFTYQFIPGEVRHLWKDRAFIPLLFSGPFFFGLIITLLTCRSVISRVALIFLLAGPLPVFFVETHIQRIFYIIPGVIFITFTGINYVVQSFRGWFPRCFLVFLLMAGILYDAATLLRALRGASLWYSDYGLTGLQWGA